MFQECPKIVRNLQPRSQGLSSYRPGRARRLALGGKMRDPGNEVEKFIEFIELFFCKKIPLSRRVEYVMDGSMDESVSEPVSERCMYVTPIRLDLL